MALQVDTNYLRQLSKPSRNETPMRERPNAKFRIKSELRGATKMPPIAPPHLNASIQLTKSIQLQGTKTPLRKISGKDESGISQQLDETPHTYGEPTSVGYPKTLSIETSNDARALISPSPSYLRAGDNSLNLVTSLTTKNTQLTPIFSNSFTAKSTVASKPKAFQRRFADMQKSPLALDRRISNTSELMTSTHERRDQSNGRGENINPYTNATPQNIIPALDPTRCSNKGCGPIKAYAANTNQGLVRNYNEDRVAIILNILKPPNVEYEGEWPACSFFGIYDGHGGAECADFLRDNLHQLIIRDKNFPFNPAEALRNGFQEAERQFLDIAQKRYDEVNKSGSCAIVALIVNDMCYIGNVGDSRAVMSSDHGKTVTALSRDHKPNEDYERDRIITNGGKVYQSQISMPMKPRSLLSSSAYTKTVLGPHRVFPGRLSVSRTFGDIEAKLPKYGGIPGVVVAEPDIMTYKLTSENDFIVIACDGIFDKMSDEDVARAAWEPTRTKAKDLHQQVTSSVENILLESMIRRTFDNITAVMIGLEGFKKAIHPEPASPERKGSNSPAKLTIDMLFEKNDNEANRFQASPLYNTLKRTLETGTAKESKVYTFGENQQNSAEANPIVMSATLKGSAAPVNQRIGEDGLLNFPIKKMNGAFRKPK